MGYRSEVAIAMNNKNYEKFMALVDKIDDTKLKENVRSLLDDGEVKKACGEYTVIRWDWIKWYESYPEVSWIENNLVAPYARIRVGEESGDIETDYECTNPETDEEDYELPCIVSPSTTIYIAEQMTFEDAISALTERNYSVMFYSKDESEEHDGVIIGVMPTFGSANDVELFSSIDDLIKFAEEKMK